MGTKIIINILPIIFLSFHDKTDSIDWVTDLDTAKTDALRDWKPILLLFTSQNCGSCKSYINGTFSNKDILSMSKDYIFVNIDLSDKQLNKVKLFGYFTATGSIPHTSFLLPNGNEVVQLRHEGILKPDELKKSLHKLKDAIPWVKNTGSKELSVILAKPLIKIHFSADTESKDLLFEIEMTKSFSGVSNKFLWVKETKKVNTPLSIRVLDPFQQFKPIHELQGTKGFTKALLETTYSEFRNKYMSEDIFFCTECQTITSNTSCCDSNTQRILTFYCDECGMAYRDQTRCCEKTTAMILAPN